MGRVIIMDANQAWVFNLLLDSAPAEKNKGACFCKRRERGGKYTGAGGGLNQGNLTPFLILQHPLKVVLSGSHTADHVRMFLCLFHIDLLNHVHNLFTLH